jgi:hypothetical protein
VYDDTEVSLSFHSVAFSSSLAPGRDLSIFRVVDSACSINLTTCRDDFVTFEPPSGSTRIAGVGAHVHGSGIVRLAIPRVSGHIIHALFALDLSSRSAQRIGRLLIGSWMQSHCGCEFLFPADYDIGLLVVPTRMGVLKPS